MFEVELIHNAPVVFGFAPAAAPLIAKAAPFIASGISGGLSWLFNRKKKKPLATGQTPGINPNATTPNAAGASVPGVSIAGLSPQEIAMLGLSAAGGALSNRPQTSMQVTTPVESPEYAGIGAALRQMLQQRLTNPASLPDAYETQGIKNINDTYGSIAQGLQNSLTSRGLAGSPMAGNADAQLALRRGGDIVNFQNSLPLIERDFKNQDIAQAMQLYNAGRGSSSTARSSGNALGGAFSDTATALGYLLRQRQLKAAGVV